MQTTTRSAIRQLLVPCLAFLLAVGCAGLPGAEESEAPDKRSNTGDPQLDLLNQGYSLLYANVSGLTIVDKVFLVKNANQQVQQIVGDISTYTEQLTADLEQIEVRYPNLRADLDPLPEIEKLKQAAAQKQRILSFTPIIGRTGPDFERTLLLTLSGGLNQLRFLASIMVEEEREPDRQTLMANASSSFLDLYKRTLKLLNEQYYKDNTYDPAEFDS